MANQPEIFGPMAGKTCLITGATAGIGYVTARELAAMGAKVIVGGRNAARCQAAVSAIRGQTGNPSVDFLVADLSSQQEVRRLAEETTGLFPRLDVLVNNAGAINFRKRRTVDGIETTFAVNHLAYFLLTNLLLDLLTATSGARVVNVSSGSHRNAGRMNPESLPNPGLYLGYRAYARSKLCNLLFNNELARRLEGTGVTANALHPGLVNTNMMANNGIVGRTLNYLLGFRGIGVEQGAETPVYLASSPEVEGVSGQYFENKQAVRSSAASHDEKLAARLWDFSARLAGLA